MTTEENSGTPGVVRWRWWLHLILIGGYFVPPTLIGLHHVLKRPALTHNVRGLLLVCGIELALFVLFFGLGCLASRASREQLLLKWRPGWWVVPLGIVYSVLMRVALGIVVTIIVAFLLGTGILPQKQVQQFFVNGRPATERIVDIHAMQHDSAYFWLTVTLSSFVVAGLREEMWRSGTLAALRALWPRTFASQSGQFAAIALIAIVFGVAHLALGPVAVALATILGLFLGIIMVLHKSIWPAVIAHGAFDAATFAMLPFMMNHL